LPYWQVHGKCDSLTYQLPKGTEGSITMSFLGPSQTATQPDRGHASAPAPQYAALCHRAVKGKVAVLLVSSRDTGRWVLPKGWPIYGLQPHEAAAREAFEEAGVEGIVDPDPLGCFDYDKRLADTTVQPCRVTVFAIRVKRLLNDFPEKGQRTRKWFRPQKAALKVHEPQLQALLAGFTPRT
jgi:8-oxo-dGTP pyrophosphatase MutT (NUDIX family)